MKIRFSDLLICPECRKNLALVNKRTKGGEVRSGLLACSSGDHVYPIVRGRPILLNPYARFSWIPPITEALGIDKKETLNQSLLRVKKLGIDDALSMVRKAKKRRAVSSFTANELGRFTGREMMSIAKYRSSGEWFRWRNRMSFLENARIAVKKKSYRNKAYTNYIRTAIGLRPTRIIDLASGAGNGINPIVHAVKGLQYAILAENDPKCLWALQFRLDHLTNRGRTEAVGCDVRRLPFADGSFDLATCNVSFAEIQGVNGLLAEVYRVLEVNGSFVFTDPATPFREPYYTKELLTFAGTRQFRKFADYADIHYSHESLVRKAGKNGFVVSCDKRFKEPSGAYYVTVLKK